jgi:osmotically inducible lipoprotein OsmB
MTRTIVVPALLAAMLALGGCEGMSDQQRRVATGVAAGAAGGALIGSVTGSAGWGAVIGATAGAAGGYIYDQQRR